MSKDVKKFSEFKSSDLIKKVEKEAEIIDGETLGKENFIIVNVLDVFCADDSEKEIELKLEKAGINLNTDIVGKDIKRGDYIYMTAILKKEKGTSFTSQATTAVVKLRVVEIYKGLKHLNLATK